MAVLVVIVVSEKDLPKLLNVLLAHAQPVILHRKIDKVVVCSLNFKGDDSNVLLTEL